MVSGVENKKGSLSNMKIYKALRRQNFSSKESTTASHGSSLLSSLLSPFKFILKITPQ